MKKNNLVEIPNVGKFRPLKDGKIHMKCSRCGLTRSNVNRSEFDLPKAAVIVMNFCPRCDKGGGFEESWYYDVDGKEIRWEE